MSEAARFGRVAVMGGGVTGLAAAHRLGTRGLDVVLIEKERHLGGKVLTQRREGFLVEGGPDSFVRGKQAVLRLAAELGLSEEVISSRAENKGSYVWWDDRLHLLPEGLMLLAPSRLRPVFGSSLLSSKGKLRLLADLVIPRRAGDGEESLESFVVRRMGREALERFAEPLLAGIHAGEPRTMSVQAVLPRFPELEREHRSLILAARRTTRLGPPAPAASHFASFRNGMGSLIAALSASLHRTEVRSGLSVIGLEAHDGGTYRLFLSDGTSLSTDGVVLALPADATARLLGSLTPEGAQAVSRIPQVSTAVVTLGYRSADLPRLRGHGFVVPTVQGRRILGVTFSSQKWESRADRPDLALIRAFIGGPRGQDLAVADEDRQRAVVQEELAAMAGIEARPVMTSSNVWRDGMHRYDVGHLDRVRRAEEAVSRHPGLKLAGAAFHGIGLNECIESGWRAADGILERRAADRSIQAGEARR